MKIPLFEGVCTALVTPFDAEGFRFPVLDALIDRQLAARVRALVVGGTTGEAAAMSAEEKLLLIQHTVRYAAGRCKVIAGTGSNSTGEAVHLSRMAQDYGADGLLVVTPYYNKTSQAGLIDHYFAIADRVSIPIIVYNVPSRTGMRIEPETYRRLSEHPQINGVKEASGDLAMVSRVRDLCADELNLWSGCDDTLVAMMALGAKGGISTCANLVPKEFVQICDACRAGDFASAGRMQNALMPLIDAIFCEVNPIPLKTALQLAGFDVGACRAPLCEPTREQRERIGAIVAGL